MKFRSKNALFLQKEAVNHPLTHWTSEHANKRRKESMTKISIFSKVFRRRNLAQKWHNGGSTLKCTMFTRKSHNLETQIQKQFHLELETNHTNRFATNFKFSLLRTTRNSTSFWITETTKVRLLTRMLVAKTTQTRLWLEKWNSS